MGDNEDSLTKANATSEGVLMVKKIQYLQGRPNNNFLYADFLLVHDLNRCRTMHCWSNKTRDLRTQGIVLSSPLLDKLCLRSGPL